MIDAELLKTLSGCHAPETLLAAILRHDPGVSMPVDVEAFARRVGILEIRVADAESPSCALMAGTGVILCAANLPAQRRRFAIAHQLGHFLLRMHGGDRQCTHRDMAETRRDTPQRKEEMQANRFAAGLLMPKPWFNDLVTSLGKPGVAHLPKIATAFAVSLETAAARYADLTQEMCALVFVKDGTMRYARPSRSFPELSIHAGDTVPQYVLDACPDDRIAWLPADPRDWITLSSKARPPGLTWQVLTKANGFQLVMLFISAAAERRADEEAEKDATEIPKFGRQRSR
jgi:Zn-dependent peptidase ImmA (M78 family)